MNNKFHYANRYEYNGIVNDVVKFTERVQLKDVELWQLVAEQFKGFSDSHDHGWRGEYWGKLMRGACMTYRYTNSAALYEVLRNSVEEMIKTAESSGRISTYSDIAQFNGWDIWSRKYVLLGFLHFYEICVDDSLKLKIIDTMKNHLDYIIDRIGDGKIDITLTSVNWQGINSSSILEPVVMLYNLTKEKRYLDFAEYIVNRGGAAEFNIFEAAYEDKLCPYEYPVTKAYELMSCFEGLIEYYKVTQKEKYLIAAENFAKKIIETEITIVGGAGCLHECFNNSALMQTYTGYNGLMLETCVTVTWMKLCFKLLCLTGKSIYADQIEVSAYNALYGAVNSNGSKCDENTKFDFPFFRDVYEQHSARYSYINKGGQIFDSYSPLRFGIRGRAIGGFRSMRDNTAYCGCCIAISAAGTALVPLSSVMKTDNGAAFIMYIDGKAELGDMVFSIQTKYPKENIINITSEADAKDYEVKLRIPSYSKNTIVKVNSETCDNVQNGDFYTITRNWSKGDTIEIFMDMNIHLEYGKKNPDDKESENHVAVIYGPLVMAKDARVSEAGKALKISEGKLKTQLIHEMDIDAICELEVEIDDNKFKMIDYASSGKTWSNASAFEAWMSIER